MRICFTPDEEIGRGVHADLPEDLNADVAYTLDGAELGEIVYETFSADKAVVTIQGVSIHPGQAKDKLVNALHLAAKIIDTLPQVTLTPETTDGRQGFIHLYQMSGTAAVGRAALHPARLRARTGLRAHGELLRQVCATIQATEPRARIDCTITPQYRNMRYWLENDMRPVELAREACRRIGVEPFSTPIRGGTDGSRLTELGVPTPNLFTGMQNIHGPLEWISVQDMARATELCVELVQLWGGTAKPATTDRPMEEARAPTDAGSPVDRVGSTDLRTPSGAWGLRSLQARGSSHCMHEASHARNGCGSVPPGMAIRWRRRVRRILGETLQAEPTNAFDRLRRHLAEIAGVALELLPRLPRGNTEDIHVRLPPPYPGHAMICPVVRWLPPTSARLKASRPRKS